MNEQPEAAAKAAEADTMKLAKRLYDTLPAACTHIALFASEKEADECRNIVYAETEKLLLELIASRDEQLAALTEERNEVLKQHRFDVQQMTEAYQELSAAHSAHAATIEGLKEVERNAEGFIKVLTEQRDEAIQQLSALRARVAELEKERDEAERSRSFNHGAAIVAIDERDTALRECGHLQRELRRAGDCFTRIVDTRFGYDGDCGVAAIANEGIDIVTKALATQNPTT